MAQMTQTMNNLGWRSTMDMVADLAPFMVELHLRTDSELPRKYGRAIKGVGGSYSEARGMGSLHRFVKVPNTSRELINTLVREFGFSDSDRKSAKVTMIARPLRWTLPSGIGLIYVAKSVSDPIAAFEVKLVESVMRARARGEHVQPITNTEIAEAEQVALKAAQAADTQRRIAEVLASTHSTSLDEFHAVVEALTQYIGDLANNNVALARVGAAQELLDRANTAYVKNIVLAPDPLTGLPVPGADQRTH